MFGFRKKRFEDTATELCGLYEKRREMGEGPHPAVLYVLGHVKANYKTSRLFSPNDAYLRAVFDSIDDLDGDLLSAREMVCSILVNTIAYELHPECKFSPGLSNLAFSDPQAYEALASNRLSDLVKRLIRKPIVPSTNDAQTMQQGRDGQDIRNVDKLETSDFDDFDIHEEDIPMERRRLTSLLDEIKSVDAQSMIGSSQIATQASALFSQARALLNDEEEFMLSRLIAWRENVARNMNLPEHMVTSDLMLMLCTLLKPTSEKSLIAVGFGDRKIKLYGTQLLGVIDRCLP